MKILGIEHLGIAVTALGERSPFWETILGLTYKKTETVASQGVRTAIYDTGAGKIELLEATGPDSTVARFLEKHGEGIHHVCLKVEDIREAIAECKAAGIDVITEEPVQGTEGYLVTFIHPRSTGGVLVELAQKQNPDS
jgi:methylmalonyl-CoA/ethylmalonyl-CoA epimerase